MAPLAAARQAHAPFPLNEFEMSEKRSAEGWIKSKEGQVGAERVFDHVETVGTLKRCEQWWVGGQAAKGVRAPFRLPHFSGKSRSMSYRGHQKQASSVGNWSAVPQLSLGESAVVYAKLVSIVNPHRSAAADCLLALYRLSRDS